MLGLRLRLPAALSFLLLGTLAAGCSSLSTLVEPANPPTAAVSEHHLATMALPREDLGLLGEGLRLDPAESGYVDDTQAAADFHVLPTTAEDLIALGRVNGYVLTYTAPDAPPPGGDVSSANSSLDLFERSSGARDFFDRVEEELALTAGTVDERIRYDEVAPFQVRSLGDEARGYRIVMSVDGYSSPYIGVMIVFRYDRLVASTAVSQFGDGDLEAEALDLARELQHRIDLSVEGRLIATPVPLTFKDGAQN